MTVGIADEIRDRSWAVRAACRGLDGTVIELLFFPGRGTTHKLMSEAKAMCRGCEVMDECREYGMNEHFGIWGGLTERERRRLRRTRRQNGRGAA